MCGRPSRGLECQGGRRKRWSWHWWGPGNTNVWARLGTGWVLPGIPPSQYPPSCTHPWYYPSPPPPTSARVVVGTSADTRISLDQGDPRGRKRTPGTLTQPATTGGWFPSAAVPSSPAPVRLLLLNSQYFSVFLSISQDCSLEHLSYISVISQLYLRIAPWNISVISQYISVFLSY